MPRTGRRRTSSGIGRSLQYTRGSFAAPVCAVAPLLRWSGKGRPRAFLREKQLRCSMKHRDKGDLLQRCGAESRDCMWWRWSRDSIAIVLSNKNFFHKGQKALSTRDSWDVVARQHKTSQRSERRSAGDNDSFVREPILSF